MALDTNETIGILLMAYGSPDNLDEMEAYLLDVRGGRHTPRDLVEEIQERYALIGGRSPLLDLTRQQAGALENELNQRFTNLRFRAYVGMRHWQPRIQQAVEEMTRDGIRHAVGLVMAPHSSRMSTGAYYANLDQALAATRSPIQFVRIESWHDHPGLIKSLAENAANAFQSFAPEHPYVVFTAHSLPVRILKNGDPYANQLIETAQLVANTLKLPENGWRFCFQSAGASEEPWLGPSIEETIPRLAKEGIRNLLVVPVGFVCDHVEILYDLDINARKLAEERGIHFERAQSLNASPAFIKALADLVTAHISGAVNPVYGS
jgi:ferrochelatase